ncbi:MAG TPA: hypothetical protein VF115_09440 [Acidimicrobiia bacterium]
MRRLLALLVAALLVPALSVTAGDTGEYRDDFGDGGYGGNDGSLEFGGPWVEFGDNGSAESGSIRIGSENCSNNHCLRIEGPGLLAGDLRVTRVADLGVVSDATLSVDIQVQPGGLLELLGSELRIQGYDGSKWVSIQTYDLSKAFGGSKVFSLASFDNTDFALRFVVTGLLGGDVAEFDGYVTIDRVAISGALQSPPTTTSTTIKPTSTTTSRPASTTSSTLPSTTTTQDASSRSSSPETTTTTTSEFASSSTSTTLRPVPAGGPPGGDPSPPTAVVLLDGGLRDPGVGLLADYQEGMMGDLQTDQVEVLGVTVDADFSMAVEVFETARIWIALLALMVSAAIIGGVDRRRRSERASKS